MQYEAVFEGGEKIITLNLVQPDSLVRRELKQ